MGDNAGNTRGKIMQKSAVVLGIQYYILKYY